MNCAYVMNNVQFIGTTNIRRAYQNVRRKLLIVLLPEEQTDFESFGSVVLNVH